MCQRIITRSSLVPRPSQKEGEGSVEYSTTSHYGLTLFTRPSFHAYEGLGTRLHRFSRGYSECSIEDCRPRMMLTACRMPVAGLNTSTIALWEGMPLSSFPGYTVTSFVPRPLDNREYDGITSSHLPAGIINHFTSVPSTI